MRLGGVSDVLGGVTKAVLVLWVVRLTASGLPRAFSADSEREKGLNLLVSSHGNRRNPFMSKKATAEAAAEPTAVSTVRVLNDDKTWRQRRSDEESEEGLKIERKKLRTRAVQGCAQSPDASLPAQLICSLRAQIARKKGAPLQVKKPL